MKPAKRNQRGRGKTLKRLCPICNTYMIRQSVKLGPAGSQKWYKTSWLCPECYHMEPDNEALKQMTDSIIKLQSQ